MEVQSGFKIKIEELPKELDTSLYMWLKQKIKSRNFITQINILY